MYCFLEPTIVCPTLTYASRTGEVLVPAPTVSNFAGPVTFTYTQNSDNPINFVNPQDPFHTLRDVDGGFQQQLNVTASDTAGNSRTCQVGVFAFVPRKFHWFEFLVISTGCRK